MGLDWFPSNRPKPGHEAEFERLVSLDVSQLDEARRVEVEARWKQLSESPFDFVRGTTDWPKLMFRAERLRDAELVIGQRLLDRAWEHQNAAELAAFGEKLMAAAKSFSDSHRLDWSKLTDPGTPFASDEEEERAIACATVFIAAQWCRWWSSKGFGLFPDF